MSVNGPTWNDQASGVDKRTDWAHERTRLAKERTFAALIRTVLSFIGFGIAVAKLLPDVQPAWVAPALGSLLIMGGAGLALLGFGTVHDVTTKLHEEGIKEPRWLVTGTVLLLLVTATVGLLVVVLL